MDTTIENKPIVDKIECESCGSLNISLDGWELLEQEKRQKTMACLFKCKTCWYSFRRAFYYRKKRELGALQAEIKHVLLNQLAKKRQAQGHLVKWHPVGHYNSSGQVCWDYDKLERHIFRSKDNIRLA